MTNLTKEHTHHLVELDTGGVAEPPLYAVVEQVLWSAGRHVDVGATGIAAVGLQPLGRPEGVETGVAAQMMHHVPGANLVDDLPEGETSAE